jgi:hypothetical protein
MKQMDFLNAKLKAQLKVQTILIKVLQEMRPEEISNGIQPVQESTGGNAQPVPDTSGNLPNGNSTE